jgi:TIR domain
MVQRVFISYSSQDERAANAVCEALESNNIRCWISHRDNQPGAAWSEMILAAINDARVVVLILSQHSNASPMVAREVERAAGKHIPIVALRIQDVAPSGPLEFFLSSHHWLDAFPLPLESYFDHLLQAVRPFLRKRPSAEGVNLYPYMVARGPAAHRAFTGQPNGPWDSSILGSETIDDLRTKLLHKPVQLAKPVQIKVKGTLFPCALLSSGWWEKRKSAKVII